MKKSALFVSPNLLINSYVYNSERMKNHLIFVVALFFLIALSACGGYSAVNSPLFLATVPPDFVGKTNPLDPDASTAGAAIFKTYCSSCHGDTGHGDGEAGLYLDPRPANLVTLNSIVADDFLYWRINTGKEGTSMPAWKGVLDEQQIWQVIAFIRTFK